MGGGRDLPQVHNVTYDQVGPLFNKSWHLHRRSSLASDSLMHAAHPPPRHVLTRTGEGSEEKGQLWEEGSRSSATSMTELLAGQIAVEPGARDNAHDTH